MSAYKVTGIRKTVGEEPSFPDSAAGRLKKFIYTARYKLVAFDPELHLPEKWEREYWVVSERRGLHWSNLDASIQERHAPPLSYPFIDFARARIRKMVADRPYLQQLDMHVFALRCLERALLLENAVTKSNGADVTQASKAVFDEAEKLLRSKRSESGISTTLSALNALAELLNDERLVLKRFDWARITTVKPCLNYRVGPEADDHRKKKMPTDDVLDACAMAFHIANDPPANVKVTKADILVTSVLALLHSAPIRIEELLGIKANAEFDGIYDGEQAYGLGWYSFKVREWDTKWIPPIIEPAARKAFKNLKELTEGGRRIAKWYEENPDVLYLPEELAHLRRKEYISVGEIMLIMGFFKPVAAWRWARAHKLYSIRAASASKRGPRKVLHFSFKEVEKAVLADLRRRIRGPLLDKRSGVKYSEALFVIPCNLLHANRNDSPCMFMRVTSHALYNHMAGAFKERVWERLKIELPDGRPVSVTSHQFRHYLTTCAIEEGLDPLVMAKWANRTPAQQGNYIHITDRQLATKVHRDGADQLRTVGPLDFQRKAYRRIIGRDEFMQLKTVSLHSSEFGYCSRELVAMPCPRFVQCLICSQHLLVKLPDRIQRVKIGLQRVRGQIRNLITYQRKGTQGEHVDRGMEVLRLRESMLTQVMSIMDDPEVEPGAWFSLTVKNEFSRLDNAILEFAKLDNEQSRRLRAFLPESDKQLLEG